MSSNSAAAPAATIRQAVLSDLARKLTSLAMYDGGGPSSEMLLWLRCTSCTAWELCAMNWPTAQAPESVMLFLRTVELKL